MLVTQVRKISRDLISKLLEERHLEMVLRLVTEESNEISEMIVVQEHLSHLDLIKDILLELLIQSAKTVKSL